MKTEGAIIMTAESHIGKSLTEVRTADNIHFGWSVEDAFCPPDSLLIRIPSQAMIVLPIDAIHLVADDVCTLLWTHAEAQLALTIIKEP